MAVVAQPSQQENKNIISPEELRSRFLLDDDIVFLNHGSFGACARPVWDVYMAWQRQLERQPVEYISRRSDPLLQSARSHLAAHLNVQPNDLTFVVNATSGLNVIARSLPLRPGDEILTTDLEYGALDFTWRHLCSRTGAAYRKAVIPTPFTTTEAIVEAIWTKVNERTRAIFLSHITSATSVILPVREICRRAREAGILTIVDGAHAPGQIPLDLAELEVDIYAGNCHKWLCAPKVAAFLHVCPEQQEWVESLTISWGWQPGHTFVTRNQQQGTRDTAAFLSVPRAIEFQAEHDWPEIRRRCHERLATFRLRLHEALGEPMLYPNDGDWFSQMALIGVPATDAAALERRLLHVHGIEVPCTEHDGRTSVRVSVQGYTTDADLAALETALRSEFLSA